MVQFEELQKLWQSQPAPAADVRDLTRALGRFGRRQDVVHGVKLAVVALWISVTAANLRHDYLALVGVGLVAVIAVALICADWRNHRAIARLDFTQPSAGFVRAAIQRLEAQRRPLGKPFWLLLSIIAALLNWLVFHNSHSHSLWFRVGAHTAATIYPFLGYMFGKWVRRRRFEAECRPLLERLTALERSLEGRGL